MKIKACRICGRREGPEPAGRVPLLDALLQVGRFLDFSVRTLRVLPACLVRRPATIFRQFERIAWGSLPIVAAAGLSIGLVTWLQTRRLLLGYGLEDTLPGVLAAAVLVETGPLLASLLVAGRLGAGLAAEMGSMGLTEEIDARVVLGSSPIEALMAPRVLACALAAPLLTIVFDFAALGGGLAAEQVAGRLSPEAYQQRSLDYLWLRDVIPATFKTAVFGLLVGLIGCWTGLASDRSTEAVGRAATRGVVRSSLAVFAANAVMVPLINAAVDAVGWSG